MKYISKFLEITEEQLKASGGKGASLSIMTKNKLPVPDGFIILSHSFENGKIKDEALREIKDYLSNESENNSYAVRSSALLEDSMENSFAGAFDTILDVKKEEVLDSILKVAKSQNSNRVNSYIEKNNIDKNKNKIAVVVQKFINPEYAGVLFTADPITGSSSKMVGNYVKGVGESLVSGEETGKEFFFNSLKFKYDGDEELRKYSKRLFKYAKKIYDIYGCHQDIEWAISDGKVYILQSRPITTLRRYNKKTYDINGTLAGDYLLSATNVGEIYLDVVSPVTYSILESITDTMGIPAFIDNVCGHAYANLSVICSVLVAFGMSKSKAYNTISDIAGEIPEGIDIPIIPINKKKMLKNIFSIIKNNKTPNKYTKIKTKEFLENMDDYAEEIITTIHKAKSLSELFDIWVNLGKPFEMKGFSCIMGGVSLKSLLKTRDDIVKICGEELANTLCSNCSKDGALESMKPLLCLDMVINGEMSKEEYMKKYGHRSSNELELACPYPYEDKEYIDNLIKEHKRLNINVGELKKKQQQKFFEAKKEFIDKFPKKENWLNKKLDRFSDAMYKRESARSKGVKIFCVCREFLLKCGEVTGLKDNIFFLEFSEVVKVLNGDNTPISYIDKRRENYNRYKTLPTLPKIIRGRFEPFEWAKKENRRVDYYNFYDDNTLEVEEKNIIRGYAGAAGVVCGVVRVLDNLSQIDSLNNGEILVTSATNIGWTPAFPRAKAIITDIGAPLSHASIVAREFGIPAVVGCKNASAILKTGMEVKVDGAKGIVTILKS